MGKMKVMFVHENVRLEFGEAVRLLKTYEDEISTEKAFKILVPFDEDSINEEQLLSKVREPFYEWYPQAEPYTAKEILEEFKDNEEKRYLALKILGPERLAQQTELEVIDQQTVTKKQRQTIIKNNGDQKPKQVDSADVQIVEKVFEDTYTLCKIKKEAVASDRLENDIYLVKCDCPSTGRVYYLFVDPTDERCTKDAIEAVAWTLMKDKDECLTKEEYLAMVEES